MSTKNVVVVVVVTLLVVVNALLINERLEKKFYQLGVQHGARQVSDKIVQQVAKTGTLIVGMPNGNQVVLSVARKQTPPPISIEAIPESKIMKDVNNQK